MRENGQDCPYIPSNSEKNQRIGCMCPRYGHEAARALRATILFIVWTIHGLSLRNRRLAERRQIDAV